MSQLGAYKTKKYYLPSSKHLPLEEQDWVVLRSTITPADVIEMNKHDTVEEQTAAGLAQTILEWSFTDENGQPAPITFENVCRMEHDDFDFLKVLGKEDIEAAEEGLSADEKKTSSDTSGATITPIPVSYPPTS